MGNCYLILILMLFEMDLQQLFPTKLTLALYVPFLVNFVILKIALPLELVLALYVLPLTFNVNLTFLMAFPLLFFRIVANFFVLIDFLNAFDLAESFVFSLVIVILTVFLVSLQSESLNFIIKFLLPYFAAFRTFGVNVNVAMPLLLVVADPMYFPFNVNVTFFPASGVPLISLSVMLYFPP